MKSGASIIMLNEDTNGTETLHFPTGFRARIAGVDTFRRYNG